MIAPEGRTPFWLSIAVAGLILWWQGMAALSVWLLPLFVFWLYREPRIIVPAAPLGIISPIDGKIIAVEAVHDRLLDRDALRIRIKPNLLGTFAIHSVTEAKVMQYWLDIDKTPGGPCVANNKCRAVWLKTDEDDDVIVIMQAGPSQQLHCHMATGERIGQGKRCGFLLFARYLDVYLALDTRVNVKAGDRVKGGESIIAQLIHR